MKQNAKQQLLFTVSVSGSITITIACRCPVNRKIVQ